MSHFQWRVSHLGLWPRMALAISLGFVALFVAFAVLGEQALHDERERLKQERLIIAQMAANQIDGLLREAVADINRDYQLIQETAYRPDLLTVVDTLHLADNPMGVLSPGITCLDLSGRVILAYASPPMSPETITFLQPYINQVQSQEMVVTAPLPDQAAAAILVPLYDNDQLAGIVVSLVRLQSQAMMMPLKQAAALGITGHATLVNQAGLTLASTFPLPFMQPAEHATFYRRAMAQGQPVVETVPVEIAIPGETIGELHVMAFAPLQLAPWAVAVGGDVDETYGGIRRLRLGLALLSIVALLGVWTVTLFGTRRLLRPVQDLTAAAQQIAAGELQTPLGVAQTGEIGTMATALDHMRTQLLTHINALADWNETLESRVEGQTEDLRQQQALTQHLLRQVITAQEEERARLARELHDAIGQTLTALELGMERLAKTLTPAAAESQQRLEQMRTLLEQAMDDLHRIIAAMRPGILDELGLLSALRWISDHTLRPLGITVDIEAVPPSRRWPGEMETTLFRIAQEAMNNVARHSQATHLAIQLAQNNGLITMTLTDNGSGWNQIKPLVSARQGLGLAGMRERALLMGGQMQIDSTPGQGTIIRVSVPLPVMHLNGK